MSKGTKPQCYKSKFMVYDFDFKKESILYLLMFLKNGKELNNYLLNHLFFTIRIHENYDFFNVF
jgi:hypothetical protein